MPCCLALGSHVLPRPSGSLLVTDLCKVPTSHALWAVLLLTEMVPPPSQMPFAGVLVHSFICFSNFLCSPPCMLSFFQARAVGLTRDSRCAGNTCAVFPKPAGIRTRSPPGPGGSVPSDLEGALLYFLVSDPGALSSVFSSLVSDDIVCCPELETWVSH